MGGLCKQRQDTQIADLRSVLAWKADRVERLKGSRDGRPLQAAAGYTNRGSPQCTRLEGGSSGEAERKSGWEASASSGRIHESRISAVYSPGRRIQWRG